MPDIQKVQDSLIEMAKDLLMLDLVPMLQGLDDAERLGTAALPIWFSSKEKTEAFRRMVVAFHGAHGAAEDFRKAHVAELVKERASWGPSPVGPDTFQREVVGDYPGGFGPEEIERRRAS